MDALLVASCEGNCRAVAKFLPTSSPLALLPPKCLAIRDPAPSAKIHAAQTRRQKEWLRSIGVPDVSPEEVTQKTLRGEYLPKASA